ncbi:unnamed protein product [Victoria cruziana]
MTFQRIFNRWKAESGRRSASSGGSSLRTRSYCRNQRTISSDERRPFCFFRWLGFENARLLPKSGNDFSGRATPLLISNKRSVPNLNDARRWDHHRLA